jgi:hypothetical protein
MGSQQQPVQEPSIVSGGHFLEVRKRIYGARKGDLLAAWGRVRNCEA